MVTNIRNESNLLDAVPTRVYEILDDIGVPQQLKGYDYLAVAITCAMEYLPQQVSITKIIYPKVAECFNTTPARAERNIRHAIEKLFEFGNLKMIHKYFGNAIDSNKGKLINSQFIYSLAKYVSRRE